MANTTLAVSPWKRPLPTPEDRALELENFEKARRASTRYLYLRYGSEYLVWFVVGLFLMFWSFHTTDTRYAGLSFWAGIGLGDAGMLASLIRARHEADRCGLM
ncbi:MAG TPA: hypothetical protein VGN73_01895 [Gemmatimonadaceae bacterium]|nr:hypothetical protein [Gemmatimonadaceae bacterium]